MYNSTLYIKNNEGNKVDSIVPFYTRKTIIVYPSKR